MAWLCVDKDGQEVGYKEKPVRFLEDGMWGIECDIDLEEPYSDNGNLEYMYYGIDLPKGSIKKLIGRELTWEDEPVELTWKDEPVELKEEE